MPTNYSAEIKYARVNSNNTALANSNDGDGDGSGATITEVIEEPTHSAVTVSGTPSGSTVTASVSVASIFEPGQYLFYWDDSANPILIGQIDSISTSTITLTGPIIGSGVSMSTKELGVSYSLVTSNEEFYIRVKTTKVSSTVTSFIQMPNFQNWRTTPSRRDNSTIKQAQSSIQRYSNIGSPVSISGTQPYVNFKVATMNNFLSPNNSVSFFSNWGQFPQYIWLKATIVPSDNTSSALVPATMYRFATNQFMDNTITVTANTLNATLYDAGYSIAQVFGGGASGTVGQI